MWWQQLVHGPSLFCIYTSVSEGQISDLTISIIPINTFHYLSVIIPLYWTPEILFSPSITTSEYLICDKDSFHWPTLRSLICNSVILCSKPPKYLAFHDKVYSSPTWSFMVKFFYSNPCQCSSTETSAQSYTLKLL